MTCNTDGTSCMTHYQKPADAGAVCTTDRRAVAYVTLGNLDTPPPPTFQNFPSAPSEGSTAPCMDWCPSPQWDQLCSDTTNSGKPGVPQLGETFGPDSLCLQSSVASGGYTNPGSGCYQVVCSSSALNATNATVYINVPGSTGQFQCAPGVASVAVTGGGFSGRVECPAPAVVCSPANTYLPDNLVQPSALATPSPGSSPYSPTAAAVASYLPYILGGLAGLLVLVALISCLRSRCAAAHKNEPPQAQREARENARYIAEQQQLYAQAQAQAQLAPRPMSRLVQQQPQGQQQGQPPPPQQQQPASRESSTYATPRGYAGPAPFYPQPSLVIRGPVGGGGPVVGYGASV